MTTDNTVGEWWAEPNHRKFVDDILEEAPESWDDDDGAETIALNYVRALERRVRELGGSLERGAETPERWRWLTSTRDLQVRAYHDDVWPKEGEALADSVMMNALALTNELHAEVLPEVGWKPWAKPRGWVNRDAYLKELVDCGHFLANMLVAVGCSDLEWERLYRAKQELNLQRQLAGYDGVEGKCHVCKRALDDGGIEMRQNPRHAGMLEWVCTGCGAVQSAEAVAALKHDEDPSVS